MDPKRVPAREFEPTTAVGVTALGWRRFKFKMEAGTAFGMYHMEP